MGLVWPYFSWGWGRKGRQEALFQLFSARSVNSFSSARLKGHIQMPLCILWICGQRALYQEIRWNWMPQKNHCMNFCWGCILISLLQSSPERFLWWANWNTFYQLLFLKARTMCIYIYIHTHYLRRSANVEASGSQFCSRQVFMYRSHLTVGWSGEGSYLSVHVFDHHVILFSIDQSTSFPYAILVTSSRDHQASNLSP